MYERVCSRIITYADFELNDAKVTNSELSDLKNCLEDLLNKSFEIHGWVKITDATIKILKYIYHFSDSKLVILEKLKDNNFSAEVIIKDLKENMFSDYEIKLILYYAEIEKKEASIFAENKHKVKACIHDNIIDLLNYIEKIDERTM